MIKLFYVISQIGRKTDPVNLVVLLKPANSSANFRYFANHRLRKTLFNIDQIFWVIYVICVEIIGNIAGFVFEEVIIGVISGICDYLFGVEKKLNTLTLGHIEIKNLQELSI